MADPKTEEPALLSSGIPRFDLVPPAELCTKLEETIDTEVKQVEDMMVKSPLDGADLQDLEEGRMDFPSLASSALYPNSVANSFHQPVSHNKSSPPSVTVGQGRDLILGFRNRIDFLDLRAGNQSIFVVQSFYWCENKSELEILSEHLRCGVQEIQKLPNGCFAVGAKRQNIHLFFCKEKETVLFCMAVDRRTSFQKCQQLCVEWLKQSSRQAATAFCIISESGVFPCSDDSVSDTFKDFGYVYIVKKVLQTVKIVLHLSSRTEKCFYIKCYNTFSVKELKEEFCVVYQEEEKKAIDISCVWLLHKDKVPADQQVLRNLWNPQDFATQTFDLEDLELDAKHTFVAFICPPDSIPVKINYKSDGTYMKSECTIMVSHQESVGGLRNAISKVTHTNPLSFKLLATGRKIDREEDLQAVLQSTSSHTIVVEQSTEIRVDVVASTESCSPTVIQKIPVSMFKYESVNTLRKEVCAQLKTSLHCVDLFHEGNLLRDHNSLRSSRLRNNDQVTAVVLRNRIRVKIRLAGRRSRWVNIEVDDQSLITVEQLKAFVLCHLGDHNIKSPAEVLESNQEGEDNFQTEMTALCKGVVLGKNESLKNAGINMNETVVLVEYEKYCFTATRGQIPIFFCKEDGQAMRVMAMCDGNTYYFAGRDWQASEQKESQQGVWTFLQPQSAVTHSGLRLCPEQSRKYIPESPSMPSLRSASGNEFCPVCKSRSMPLLTSAVNTPVSAEQCRYSSVHKSGAFPHPVDNISAVRINGLTTSTPSSSPEKSHFPWGSEQDSTSQSSSLSKTEQTDAHSPLLQAEHHSEHSHWPASPADFKLSRHCLKPGNQSDLVKTTFGPIQTRVLDGDGGYFTEPVTTRAKWYQKTEKTEKTMTDANGRKILSQRLKVELEGQIDGVCSGNSMEAGCPIESAAASNKSLCDLLRSLSIDKANNNSQQTHASSMLSICAGNSVPQDNTYMYVKREVIIKVADALEEGERLRFFTLLGLEAKTVKDIEAVSTRNNFDRNLSCLHKWLRQNRNPSALCTLTKVLTEIQRNDIVEGIDKIQKCQEGCSCKLSIGQ